MSYTRWSNEITGRFTPKCEHELDKRGFSFNEIRIIEENIGNISDWYIFWDTLSGELLEDQVLSIWHRFSDHPSFDYPQVKDMYDKDDWTSCAVNITQKDHLRSCVKSWLEDVEEEYDSM